MQLEGPKYKFLNLCCCLNKLVIKRFIIDMYKQDRMRIRFITDISGKVRDSNSVGNIELCLYFNNLIKNRIGTNSLKTLTRKLLKGLVKSTFSDD